MSIFTQRFFLLPVFIFFIALNNAVHAQTIPNALDRYYTGRDFENRGRMIEAESYYDEAVTICTNEISGNRATRDTYTALTWSLQRLRRHSDVIIWGERGLRLYNDEYRIVSIMGEAYFYLDDYELSLNFLQRYANSVPQGERTSVAYFFIGEIYRMTGKFRHADIAYTTAVRLEPGLPLWWYRLGSVREASGEFQLAIEAYERALRLNPNYREANDGLIRSRRQTG